MNQLSNVSMTDFQDLNELRVTALNNQDKALPEVAKQFEGIFLQAMLKSMRVNTHFVEEDSPFRGKNADTFEGLLDAQYSHLMTENEGLGLAKSLTSQISQTYGLHAEEPKETAKINPFNVTNVPNENKIKNVTISNVQLTEKQIVTSKEASENLTDFVHSLWPYAKEAASVLGLDPKILIAQAALETGWGKNITKSVEGISSNNLFNIKASSHSTDAVTVKTTEYLGDKPVKMNASFRSYASVGESFQDYVHLIQQDSRYHDAKNSASSPEQFVKEIHKAGYATDPEYSDKILSIYHGDELAAAIEDIR